MNIFQIYLISSQTLQLISSYTHHALKFKLADKQSLKTSFYVIWFKIINDIYFLTKNVLKEIKASLKNAVLFTLVIVKS